MHFFFLLVLLLLAAAVHASLKKERTVAHVARLVLMYVLVGYCGVPMLGVSLWALMSPDGAAAFFGFGPAGSLLAFFGYAFLGMSLLSLLALRYRGSFLIAPAVCWAIYWGGATTVHLTADGQRAMHSHGGALEVFASHGLIAVILVIALLASGLLRERT